MRPILPYLFLVACSKDVEPPRQSMVTPADMPQVVAEPSVAQPACPEFPWAVSCTKLADDEVEKMHEKGCRSLTTKWMLVDDDGLPVDERTPSGTRGVTLLASGFMALESNGAYWKVVFNDYPAPTSTCDYYN